MMHGREKSDSVIVAEKPTNKVVSATGGAGGAKGSKARFGHSAENACHRRWSAYGKFAVTHPRWEPCAALPHFDLGFSACGPRANLPDLQKSGVFACCYRSTASAPIWI
jgi:hypothetical protein